jgi:methylmalonyl-CoA/ethylmalonyl-CoA epimerase
MIKKYDHVGMAVTDTGAMVALLSKLFGFKISDEHDEPAAGFKSTTLSSADVTIELIQPVGPQSMIQKFIEKRGGGLHHISIQVDDLDAEMKRLKELGVQFTGEEPAQMHDAKLIFVHPRSTNGLLIELKQLK